MNWSDGMSRWWRKRGVVVPNDPEQLALLAEHTLECALSDEEEATRLPRLRTALELGEQLPGERGDRLVLEASLHLGEWLRAEGDWDEAEEHFERAMMRSFRVPDPVGRQRRAGVLSRLAILDQEAGDPERARIRYREALALGRDCESAALLAMLTQAAFNLGLLENELGDEDRAVACWGQALELGMRSGGAHGMDSAAVAAFNLGLLLERRGQLGEAQRMHAMVARLTEVANTPHGRMACAKSALALASHAERAGLAGAADAQRHYSDALRLGRESGMPEGHLAALQGALGLGESAVAAGRHEEAIGHYREALRCAAACPPAEGHRFELMASLRLGQAFAELDRHDESLHHLRRVLEAGAATDDALLRELAGQAACSLHRSLAALERWRDAQSLSILTLDFARTLAPPTGRALEAAVRFADAYRHLDAGQLEDCLAALAESARLGRESGAEAGVRLALDALLLAGHLHRRAGRLEQAVSVLEQAIACSRESDEAEHPAEHDTLLAMAHVNLAHVLLRLERLDASRESYERALEHGRASGMASGRAAAANAALHLASMPGGDTRAHLRLAEGLGRASGTAMGQECAKQAGDALARLAAEPDPE